jgi:uncharacterized protein (DUF983 family)
MKLVTGADRADHGAMSETPHRSLKISLWRGFLKHCPSCGVGKLFSGYLGAQPKCPHCGEDLYHQRADDAPPYFTMMVVGHTVVPLLLVVEKLWQPELWIHFVLWLPLTLIMTLWLLPRVKGAIIGLQWSLRMHGFAALPASSEKPIGP